MMERNLAWTVSVVLLIIGGLNWALVGIMDIDAVAAIFGAGSVIAKIIYILVGLAALYMLYALVVDRM
ncbi:MAG TPA: DUF378 domain-containing protein [Candidatus Diapherotrites archaeon]|uniref:DUF378 domain-containing protein n=1 Tax=Candidatus Iainarchaeum sp. TaxID=3101447 RepID=A0A7J4IVH3_9ARCH|nr:DUF378 domain-containing protein [Candidatus Diapherotrites archaeon]